MLLTCIFLTLGINQKPDAATGAENQEGSCNGEPAGAVVAGSGQVKAGGVDHLQGRFCVGRAVVCEHGHGIAVHRGGGGKQMMLQVLLGNIVQIPGVMDDRSIPGVVLDQAQNVGGINVAERGGFLLGNDNRNVLFSKV